MKIAWINPWFGTKSLKFNGQIIWNALPVNIKTAENLNAFKDLKKSGMAFHAIALSALINSSFF